MAETPVPDAARPEVPVVAGPWWRLVAPPVLEQYHQDGIQAVDFTIYRALDGTWQLISCLRGTAFPGGGRLLYRWEASSLTDTDWRPCGIFRTSDPALGHREGVMQAPHCVLVDGKYYLFYNSQGAHCLVGGDGKHFAPYRDAGGDYRFFEMGRDVMLFDNRERDGLWYAFFTDPRPGVYIERRGHTVSFRTASKLEGPWSAEKSEAGVVTPLDPDDPYAFIDAESPFVLWRGGFYYRLEQMHVLASPAVRDWQVPILTTLTPGSNRAFYAPEVVVDGDRHYVAGYKYDREHHGIYMARMEWE